MKDTALLNMLIEEVASAFNISLSQALDLVYTSELAKKINQNPLYRTYSTTDLISELKIEVKETTFL